MTPSSVSVIQCCSDVSSCWSRSEGQPGPVWNAWRRNDKLWDQQNVNYRLRNLGPHGLLRDCLDSVTYPKYIINTGIGTADRTVGPNCAPTQISKHHVSREQGPPSTVRVLVCTPYLLSKKEKGAKWFAKTTLPLNDKLTKPTEQTTGETL